MVLGDGHEPGTPLGDVFPLGDDVLEIEVTGNRPDLLAVYGIAREVAAVFPDAELQPYPAHAPAAMGDEHVDVAVESFEARAALHRAALPRRHGRRLAAVAEGAADRGRACARSRTSST